MIEETKDTSLEETVLKESILSAVGLNTDALQIGIKGDPYYRESVANRVREHSGVDDVIDDLIPNLEDMMLNRGTYRIFVGFNSGEIRTNSVFDPLRSEIHTAEKLADPAYISRQFPAISYDEKVRLMRELYRGLRSTNQYAALPDYWRNIFKRRSDAWGPLNPEDITTIFGALKVLRDIEDYYLRNITICMVQNIVRMQFNCDGTQIISAQNLKKFLEENLP